MQQLRTMREVIRFLWPHYRLYNKQWEIVDSVEANYETVVPAGNMLGKDYIAALIVLAFFLSRHPCRVLTTSVDYSQLSSVLWGEMRRHIQEAKYPLEHERGGPLVINHMHIRKVRDGRICGLSYIRGRVAARGEGMLGHHVADVGDGIARTMLVADEASGVDDETEDRGSTWAKRKLFIGNCYPCNNFFKRAVEHGEQVVDGKLHRKLVHITALDSPNVRLALAQQRAGLQPTGEVLVPGILPYNDYRIRLATWDDVRKCISLYARFWKGAELLLFPPSALAKSEQLAEQLRDAPRKARAIGVDPGEGSAETSWTSVDERGLISLEAFRTPDTSVIEDYTIDFGRRNGVPPSDWMLDVGGGGKQIADRLRKRGYPVRTVAFGGAPAPPPHRGTRLFTDKLEQLEDRFTYASRRGQMYHELSLLTEAGWAIPVEQQELIRQLAPIPKRYDGEGRIVLPPKGRRHGQRGGAETLTDLIGCSPDRADSTVVAVHAMLHRARRFTAGPA